MASSVDDIVQPSHYIEVPVRIEIPSIACCVVPRSLIHVFFEESFVVVVESAHERWRHW